MGRREAKMIRRINKNKNAVEWIPTAEARVVEKWRRKSTINAEGDDKIRRQSLKKPPS